MKHLVDKADNEDSKRVLRMAFYESMKVHQLKTQGISGFSLQVTLTASENTYIDYPARGVLVVLEHSTDLRISQAVFHHLKDDGRLGPPVEVRRPKFIYE